MSVVVVAGFLRIKNWSAGQAQPAGLWLWLGWVVGCGVQGKCVGAGSDRSWSWAHSVLPMPLPIPVTNHVPFDCFGFSVFGFRFLSF